MEGSFGTRLRAQREQQQIPLADIAERTKIKLSLLEALERDDVSHWPTGIFRRSFLRAYAQAIGLDADVVLREFAELYPEPAEEDVTAVIAAAREPRRPSTRLGYLISSAFNALPVRKKAAPEPAVLQPELPVLQDIPTIDALEEPVDTAPHAVDSLSTTADVERDLFEEAEQDRAAREWRPPAEPVGATPAFEDALDHRAAAETRPLVPSHDAPPPVRAAAYTDFLAQTSRRVDGQAPDYASVAELCTRLARAVQPRDVVPVLEDLGRLVDAVGLIVWMWDPATRTLAHVLAHGYSHDVVSRLPRVRCETDNAIAEAFRSAETRVVSGSGTATGAVVVPIVTGAGCAGVLAMELQDRGEERDWVRGVGAIVAAQFAALFGFPTLAEAVGA